ncbi:10098_t:CDS:2, partial [Racocetra persica]
LVSISDRSQSFISITLAKAFTESTILNSLSPNLQHKKDNRLQQENYRATKAIQQANRYRNIARCTLNGFNFELEDSFDLSIWQHKLSNLDIRSLLEPPLLAISQLLTGFDITTASPNLNLNMMRSLQAKLDHINPFVQIFQSAGQQATRNSALKLKISN